MGETRSAFQNDSGLALNLDGMKIDREDLDGERNIGRPRWDILRENALWDENSSMILSWMDVQSMNSFMKKKNHDGTGRITSSKRGPGLNQTWKEDTSWNEIQASPLSWKGRPYRILERGSRDGTTKTHRQSKIQV